MALAAVNEAAFEKGIAAPEPADPWVTLSRQRLQLNDSVSVDELRYRGQRWYLLRNHLSRRQVRLSAPVFRVLAQLDGKRTLAEACGDEPCDTPLAQQQLLNTLMQLQEAGMLDMPGGDIQALLAQRRRQRRMARISRWLRLLSPRLPLFDPDRFLDRTLPALNWLFHPLSLLVMLGLTALAGLQAMAQWDELTLYGAQRLDDPRSWLLLIGLYPLIKALHEFGHGFAAKAAGAEVNEMGITLLVFIPVPYVDASDASVVPSKYRRMLVSAAGILVEMVLAALALFAWLQLPDGWLREAAFAGMLIGGVSTLLFNGNPLLRFDGYFVLSDALEIPNLATRAAAYYGYLFKRYILGIAELRSPVTAPGERAWFLVYASTSFLYRLTITLGIAVFLFTTVPVLGALMAVWLLLAQFAVPLGRQLYFLLFSPLLAEHRVRALSTVGALAAILFGALALAPVSNSTRVEGVVLMPEQAVVRAEMDGFLIEQWVEHGARVARGDPLFALADPELVADIAFERARVREFEARYDALPLSRRLDREIHTERLAEARAELEELEQRYARRIVHSPADGRLRIPFNTDSNGRFIRQGDLLAYVADDSGAVVRVVASQKDAGQIRHFTDNIQVRTAGYRAEVLTGQLIDEVPAASDTLPSAALGSRAGGAIPVDARDAQGRKTLQNIYAFDIAVPYADALRYVGSRVEVRFQHSASPLLARAYDTARRFVLEEIGE